MNNKPNINLSPRKALLMLEHLKMTNQYFCFADYGTIYTAEDLLSAVKGRAVSFDEAIEYLTDKTEKAY